MDVPVSSAKGRLAVRQEDRDRCTGRVTEKWYATFGTVPTSFRYVCITRSSGKIEPEPVSVICGQIPCDSLRVSRLAKLFVT